MIRFDNIPPEIIQAMCTPMHQIILPPGPNQQHMGSLWLGSFQAGSDPELLRQHQIAHLVQVLDVPWLPSYSDLPVIITRFDIMDVPSADLRSHLDEACARIDKSLRSGKNVLVHCQQVSGFTEHCPVWPLSYLRVSRVVQPSSSDISSKLIRCPTNLLLTS